MSGTGSSRCSNNGIGTQSLHFSALFSAGLAPVSGWQNGHQRLAAQVFSAPGGVPLCNILTQSPRNVSHWLSLGHVPTFNQSRGSEGWGCSDWPITAQSQKLGVDTRAQLLRVERGGSPEENRGTVSRRECVLGRQKPPILMSLLSPWPSLIPA